MHNPPAASRRFLLAVIASCLLFSVATHESHAEEPGEKDPSLQVAFLRAQLLEEDGQLMLPENFVQNVRSKFENDANYQCFSVNLMKSTRRIWIPLRGEKRQPVFLPGGAEAKVSSLELQLRSPLPPETKTLRLLLENDRSVVATVVRPDLLRVEPLSEEASLSGFEPEELLKWLILTKPIGWESVSPNPAVNGRSQR